MRSIGSRDEAIEHLRTKFMKSGEARALMEKYDIVVKRGDYSCSEVKLIDEVMRMFLEKHQLSIKDLHGFFLEENPSFPIRDLLLEISNALEYRTLTSVWIYVSYHYHPYVDAKWEPENEIQLLKLVQVLGFKWKEICGIMKRSSRKCIFNYYKIMGIKGMSKCSLKLAEGIPSTEDGWNDMCKRLRTSRKRLSHLINGYIANRLANPFWNEYNDVVLIAYAIFYNHFCSVKIKIPELLQFLDGNADKLPERESINRDEVSEEISRFIPDLKEYCLDVSVDIEDIFWGTITMFLRFSSGLLKSKFVQISKIYGIKTFGDLIAVFRDIAVNCYLCKIKNKLKEEIDKVMNEKMGVRKKKTSRLAKAP